MANQSPTPNGIPKPEPPKRSAVEKIKEASRHLRGTIALELLKETDHFPEQDKQLLKFHGSYQQEDRDARKNRSKAGVGKHYMFMVRCKIPGGQLTASQYLAIDDLAGKYGNATLRLTARQGMQLHGVLKGHLHDTIAGINACLLTTLGACGDVSRNVMACPAPACLGQNAPATHAAHAQLQDTARTIAVHLAPRSRAYHEIWLNGKQLEVVSGEALVVSGKDASETPDHSPLTTHHSPLDEVEPIYGNTYLPRKFKIGFAFPDDNCIDVYAQDLGFLAIVEDGKIVGYNVLVGGGMGMSHGNPNTFPYTGKPICYVPADRVLDAAEAVVRLFRDHGNRGDRKRARIKYLVHDWGVDRFREVLAGYVPFANVAPKPIDVTGYDLHLGWREQGDGKWYYGVSIENGRIKDEGALRLRTALRRLVSELQPSLRITPAQDLLLCDLPESARPHVEHTLEEHGIVVPERLSMIQKLGMACPAIPTCGLAISESERVLPAIIDQLKLELKNLGLADEPIAVRMTGCPNGCARPFQSDIGIVGRSGDKYTIYVGGRLLGDRLNFLFKDLVPEKELVPMLAALLRSFKEHRRNREPFGDYCQRLGRERLMAELETTSVISKPETLVPTPTAYRS